jgi:uncharacterized protein involved in exopolysaccharide biosynthesis
MDNLDKNIAGQEHDVDLIEFGKTVWQKRKFVIKISIIGAIIGLVLAFSLPKEYKTEVVLIPDSGTVGSGNLGMLAAMAGINLQQNAQEMPPQLYPDIVVSTPFLVGLFDVHVKDKEDGIDTSLYDYMMNHQNKAWWSYILELPKTIINLFSSEKEEESVSGGSRSSIIHLSDEQEDILVNLENRIDTYVDNKTGEISLSVKMQSAVISAFVADTITSYMQEYIINFRTQKARQDLSFVEELYQEAQVNYYNAQQNLATYLDGNLSIVSASYKTAQERLMNEATLAYGVYNQMAQQLQMAKMKVQDTTPVYTVIQPAVVPLKRTSPKRMLILVGMMFLSFSGACVWVFMKDYKSIIL